MSKQFNNGEMVRVNGTTGEYIVLDYISLTNTYRLVNDSGSIFHYPADYCYQPISSATVVKTSNTVAGNNTGVAIYDDKYGWTGYSPVQGGIYKISDNFDLGAMQSQYNKLLNEIAKGPEVKCECGTHKTYGENCNSDMHDRWCPAYKKV